MGYAAKIIINIDNRKDLAVFLQYMDVKLPMSGKVASMSWRMDGD